MCPTCAKLDAISKKNTQFHIELDTPISELGFSNRAYLLLMRSGCRTLLDVLNLVRPYHWFDSIRGAGRISAQQVIDRLYELNKLTNFDIVKDIAPID